MFMPPNPHDDDEFRGAGLTNLEYALLRGGDGAHRLGLGSVQLLRARHRQHGSVHALRHAGAEAQMAEAADERRDPLRLPDDRARSGFVRCHQYRDAGSSRDGDHYVINGRKWWSSGVGDPRCKVAILMGKTDSTRKASAAVADPGAARHPRREGGENAAACSAMTMRRTAMLRCCSKMSACRRKTSCSGEGRGFEIAQGRLGPGRIHHCMRTIGVGRRGAGEDGHGGCRRAPPSARRSSSIRCGSSASARPAPTSR